MQNDISEMQHDISKVTSQDGKEESLPELESVSRLEQEPSSPLSVNLTDIEYDFYEE